METDTIHCWYRKTWGHLPKQVKARINRYYKPFTRVRHRLSHNIHPCVYATIFTMRRYWYNVGSLLCGHLWPTLAWVRLKLLDSSNNNCAVLGNYILILFNIYNRTPLSESKLNVLEIGPSQCWFFLQIFLYY